MNRHERFEAMSRKKLALRLQKCRRKTPTLWAFLRRIFVAIAILFLLASTASFALVLWFATPGWMTFFLFLCGTCLGAAAYDVKWACQAVRYWPDLERFVDWSRVEEVEPPVAPLPSGIDGPASIRQDSVAPAVRSKMARGLKEYRRKTPTFGALSLRILPVHGAWIVGVWVVAFFCTEWFVTSGWMTPIFVLCGFGLGVMARQMGSACDVVQYWPALERFVDWQRVEEAAG